MKHSIFFFIIIIILLIGNVFAVNFVKPDTSNKIILKLVPGQKYVSSFLAREEGSDINIISFECDICSNLRKEGPYYFFDIFSDKELTTKLKIIYKVKNNLKVDVREIDYSYDFVKAFFLIPSELRLLRENYIYIVVKNESDTDVNTVITSNLPNYVFEEQSIFVKAHSEQKIRSKIIPYQKGYNKIIFYSKFGNYQKIEQEYSFFSKYNLKSLLRENLFSFYVLNPQFNFFYSLRFFLSFL